MGDTFRKLKLKEINKLGDIKEDLRRIFIMAQNDENFEYSEQLREKDILITLEKATEIVNKIDTELSKGGYIVEEDLKELETCIKELKEKENVLKHLATQEFKYKKKESGIPNHSLWIVSTVRNLNNLLKEYKYKSSSQQKLREAA